MFNPPAHFTTSLTRRLLVSKSFALKVSFFHSLNSIKYLHKRNLSLEMVNTKHWTVCLTVMSAICLNTLLVVTNDLSNIGCILPIFPPSLPQTLRPPRTSRMRSPRSPAVMQRKKERSPPAGRGATSEASKWQNIFEDFKCNDLKTR